MTTTAAENPLVPNAVLRKIFISMVEARLLEQHLLSGTAKKKIRAGSIRGEEACRASSVACLESGDLVSDPSTSVVADLLLGAPMRALLRSAPGTSRLAGPLGSLRLPRDPDAREQIRTALGAAHALLLGGAQRFVLVYSQESAAPLPFWKSALAQAGARSLPILFVLLPPAAGAKAHARAGVLSERAMSWGVPGIAVDAADAVALYRVMRESTARVRAGDGPVLVECLHWPGAGRALDPLAAIKQSIQARGVATAAWQRQVVERFERRLALLAP